MHSNYTITPDQYSIIAAANLDSELIIDESILIKQLQPDVENMKSLN